jgi:predicted NBD/HSP70 family sugar kinase
MATTIGLGDSWHSKGPSTEQEFFDRFKVQLGEETIVSGALAVDGKIYIPSRAAKRSAGELELFCVDQNGEARILKAREGCQEVLATSLSLAW